MVWVYFIVQKKAAGTNNPAHVMYKQIVCALHSALSRTEYFRNVVALQRRS